MPDSIGITALSWGLVMGPADWGSKLRWSGAPLPEPVPPVEVKPAIFRWRCWSGGADL